MEHPGAVCYILFREGSESRKVTAEQVAPERAEEVLLRCRDPKEPWVEESRRRDRTMDKTDWIRCPKCGSKTRTMIREHTVLEDFPLFCPKCRYTCVIRFRDGKMEETVPEKA